MIEVIYKDEKQEMNDGETEWNLPKNIRQIGIISRDYRIYIEDYVYTFLRKAALAQNSREDGESCLAVLLGETRWQSGNDFVFIRGALLMEGEEITEEHIEITQNMWQKVHEDQEQYFEGQEIVGWFLARQPLSMEPSDLIQKVHRNQFGGEKILMLMDASEQEDAFFRYENNFLVRQSGYYIYYEKNTQMQNYMLEKNPQLQNEERESIQDDAVKAFRTLIKKKKNEEEPTETEEKPSVFSYAAAACLVMALAVVGVRFYRNYQTSQGLEEEAKTVSAEMKREVQITQVPAETETPTPPIVSPTTSPTVTPGQKTETSEEEEAAVPTAGAAEKESAISEEESAKQKTQRTQTKLRENRTDSETAAVQAQKSYTIRPGDTLYQISIEKYGTMDKVADICRANGISEDEIIYPGQIIVLP